MFSDVQFSESKPRRMSVSPLFLIYIVTLDEAPASISPQSIADWTVVHARSSYTSISTSGSGGGGDGADGTNGIGAGADSIIIPELPSLSVDCRIPETDRLTTVIATATNATANIFGPCDANLITVLEVELLIIDYER